MITTESYAFPGTLMEIISDDECWWYSHVECFDLKNLKCVCVQKLKRLDILTEYPFLLFVVSSFSPYE